MKLFGSDNKHKDKSKNTTEHELLKRLGRFEEDLEQRFSAAEAKSSSSSCLPNFLSCLRSTNNKIPQSYKDIAAWLTKLTINQVKQGFNEEILISALYATLEYVSQDTFGTEVPAQIIKDLIEELAKELKLDLQTVPDLGALVTYCDDHQIDIPSKMSPVLAIGTTLSIN